MGVQSGVARFRVVVAALGTIAALSGIALGMVFANGRDQLWEGLILVAGFVAAWYLFEAVVWSPMKLWIRTPALLLVPAILSFVFAIVYAMKGDHGSEDLVILGLSVIGISGIVFALGWILSGFAIKEPTEKTNEL